MLIYAKAMRKDALVTGEIYHICNRSTEGISIFSVPEDADKFLETLHQFNTIYKTPRDIFRAPLKHGNIISQPLVEVYAAALMPNHFHLCVKQLVDNGITSWMHRSCNSFSHYFNNKINRKGTLFMGRFKGVPILDNKQLFHVLVYIHANPLDLIFPKWRDGLVDSWQEAKTFLQNYRWSSFGLYENNEQILSTIKDLVHKESLSAFIKEWGGIEAGLKDWSVRNFYDPIDAPGASKS